MHDTHDPVQTQKILGLRVLFLIHHPSASTEQNTLNDLQNMVKEGVQPSGNSDAATIEATSNHPPHGNNPTSTPTPTTPSVDTSLRQNGKEAGDPGGNGAGGLTPSST